MTGRYKAYPEYKESDVDWLGVVPSHWDMTKTSRYYKVAMGQTILKEDLVDEGKWPVFSATENNHYFGRIDSPNVRLQRGDIVIPARGNSIGAVKLVNEPASTTQTTIYCKLLKQDGLFQSYIYYFLVGERRNLFRFTQTAIPQITTEEVGNNPLLLPPFEEQQKIASFLDHETAKIDTLIAKQEKLIELLKEKRQAVISHAVTKGLNPDAPMRDSGVEWLGEVPEHWEVMQFRRVTKLSQGLQIPQSERFYENGKNRAEYITIKSINAGEKSTFKEYIESKNSRVFCTKNEILLARTGATGEVITDVEGVFHNNFFKVSFNEKQINKNYLYKLLTAKELKSHLLMLAGTTTIPDLNHGAFLSTSVAIPPLNEQKKINAFILNKNDRYGLLMSKATNAIELMLERKTALISAAVTGKIDVRDWKPQGVQG